MSKPISPTYLNVRETAKRLGVHENTIRNWVRSGHLTTQRVPGLRGHRFDERDIERLERQRGSAVSSVAADLTLVGPELVDATQLDAWGKAREAWTVFPELIRRLLAATPGVTGVSIRAGDGVSLEGWDGVAESSGTSYLPAGTLALEFGTGKSSMKTKADNDYENRVCNPVGLDPRSTTFVFATPRRWSRKGQWASERRDSGAFSNVVALDADDLEGWLQEAPDIHQWISELLGLRPQNVETLDRWWSRFSSQTSPALPAALFLAGRQTEQKRLLAALEGPQRVVIQAPWRKEALAFVAAALGADDTPRRPVLLVSSPEVWDRTVSRPAGMTLIPLFEGADLDAAERGGHHVLVAVGRSEVVRDDAIRLGLPGRMEAAEALEAVGLAHERAYPLAALARRSMPSLARKLSRDPSFSRPPWSEPPDADVLAALALIGQWKTVAGDLEVIERITGHQWAKVERILNRWRQSDDPPFILTGDQWQVAWSEEAFLILRDTLTTGDIDRWKEQFLAVFDELDPRLDLPAEERVMAGVRGIQHPRSPVLRTGLTESLAVVGASAEEVLPNQQTGGDLARGVVRTILQRANDDSTGRAWASLGDFLPLFAEAAPDTFLDAVHDDLDHAKPILGSIFRDSEGESAWLADSPHTGLLWAIERLAWSPDHLMDATWALARLAAIDPGGRLSNRPLNSLEHILVTWIRHTSSTTDERAEAVARICTELPDVGWELVLKLWPSSHATSMPPAAPQFRDWLPDSRGVPVIEVIEYTGKLVDLGLDLAAAAPARWKELVDRISPLPPKDRERVIAALEGLADSDDLDDDVRLELWETLHEEIARHRRYADTDWALDEESLARLDEVDRKLEPVTTDRFSYLFDWHPHLPDVGLSDYASYEQRLSALRADAVQTTLREGGVDGLSRLARRSVVPNQLGWTAAEIAKDDPDIQRAMLSALDASDDKLRELAKGWAQKRQLGEPADWYLKAAKQPELEPPARKIALALEAPQRPDVWDALETLAPEIKRGYWDNIFPRWIAADDVPRAVDELLAHQRPWTAIDLLTMELHRRKDSPSPLATELVEAVLVAALEVDPTTGNSHVSGYEVGLLLDYLERSNVPADKLAQYEFPFLALTDQHREPKALHAALASDPSLFVDLVKRVYRGKNEPPRDLDAKTASLARHAWDVLRGWHTLPGLRDDGSIDAKHLTWWVTEARLALAEADRGDIGDEQIGQVLSSSPPGTDGIWPAEAVRDLIETVGNERVESGLYIGERNARGVTTRGVFDGGAQERAHAETHREAARQLAKRWRRTSRVVRDIADSYEADARREDNEAGIRSDT